MKNEVIKHVKEGIIQVPYSVILYRTPMLRTKANTTKTENEDNDSAVLLERK